MSKITKKSVNSLMDIYKKHKTYVVLKLTDPNNKDLVLLEIPVKTELSIEEQGAFVDRVVNACFDANGDYITQYLDAVFMITLLQMTTNVPVYEKTTVLDDGNTQDVIDIDKTYELCKAINLVGNVKDSAYKRLVDGLRQMVVDKLEYRKQYIINRDRYVMSELCTSITNFISMATEKISDFNVSDFSQSIEQLSKLTNDLNSDNLASKVVALHAKE